jgi:hypothetical protein
MQHARIANMKTLIVISALCVAGAASARTPDPSPRTLRTATADAGMYHLALKERMGQL